LYTLFVGLILVASIRLLGARLFYLKRIHNIPGEAEGLSVAMGLNYLVYLPFVVIVTGIVLLSSILEEKRRQVKRWTKLLDCPPFGLVAVCINDEFEESTERTRELNLVRLCRIWDEVWPPIYKSLWSVVSEYEHQQAVLKGKKVINVSLPDFSSAPTPTWNVQLEVVPFAGVYDVTLEGTRVIDSGATF
jgi:hypothetical protein